MQVPAVGAGVQPADKIDQAADDLDEYRRDTLERLGAHDEILVQLRDRITSLEERSGGCEPAAGSSKPIPGKILA